MQHATHPSSLKMLPSYVTHLPTGREVGKFYAVDLGGTNLRCCCYELQGGGRPVQLVNMLKSVLPTAALCGNAEDLFDCIKTV